MAEPFDIEIGEEHLAPEPDNKQSDAEDRAVRIASRWFEDDQSDQESIFEEWEEMDKIWRGAHWDLSGAQGTVLRSADEKLKHPNNVENVAFSLVEGMIAEFSSQEIELVDFPVEKGDDTAAKQMTDLKKFLWYKNRFQIEKPRFLRNLFKLGTGIYHPHWDPTWKGGKGPNKWLGEVRLKSLHPQMLFPDCRIRDDINDGARIHKAAHVTLEWIREHFPERGRYVQQEVLDETELVGTEGIDDEDDQWSRDGQALLIQTWYKGRPLLLTDGERDMGPGLHVLNWANLGQKLYLSHANYVYFEPGEETLYPFIWRQCYPRENSVWGYGELWFQKYIQIAMNKTAELVLESNMHGSMGQTYYEPGTMDDKQKAFIMENSGLPGMHFPVNDVSKIIRMVGKGADQSLLTDLMRLQKVMETVAGRFDISQGRTPGSVTAFRALDLLSQRAQVRLRLKEVAIRTAEEDLANYANRLILQNYDEMRSYRVLGPNNKQAETMDFDLASIKRVYLPNEGSVIPWKDWTPPEGMVEGVDYEVYTPDFDSQARVSTALPSDRLFYMELAKELFLNQRIGDKIFWHVIENGRFPPWEHMVQEAAQAQQMMQAQQAQQMGGQAVPVQEVISQLSPEEQQALAEASPEEQQQILTQIAQQTGVQLQP